MSKKKKKKAPTEGELFILEYLKYKNIEFERDKELDFLKFDKECKIRFPDFYLPKYKVYIEFNGRWNISDEDKKRYRNKKEVYRKNKLPCVYIYPENLGIIDFLLPKRLIEVLKNHSMKKELLKFQFKRFIDDRGDLFVWLVISLLILSLLTWNEDKGLMMVLIALGVNLIYRLIDGYYKFFIKNEHNF